MCGVLGSEWQNVGKETELRNNPRKLSDCLLPAYRLSDIVRAWQRGVAENETPAGETKMSHRQKMTHSDLTQIMAESVVDRLKFYFDLFGDKDKAIAQTKEETCAGPKPWKIALEQLGW